MAKRPWSTCLCSKPTNSIGTLTYRHDCFHTTLPSYDTNTFSGIDALHRHSCAFTGKADFNQVIPHFIHPPDNSREIPFDSFDRYSRSRQLRGRSSVVDATCRWDLACG